MNGLPLIARAAILLLLMALLPPFLCEMALAQTTGNSPASSQTTSNSQTAPSTPLSEADLWVKIIGGIVAGITALIGLPAGLYALQEDSR